MQPWFDFRRAARQLSVMCTIGAIAYSGPCARHGSGRLKRPALLGLLPVLLMPDPRGGKRG